MRGSIYAVTQHHTAIIMGKVQNENVHHFGSEMVITVSLNCAVMQSFHILFCNHYLTMN